MKRNKRGFKQKIVDFKNRAIVENHQLLSFSRYFAKARIGVYNNYTLHESDTVFFPGCSLMSLGEDAVFELYKILKLKYPNMGIAGYCCAKPSKHIDNGRKFKKRISFVKSKLDGKIFTACPNCYKTFSEEGMKVESIWPIIDEFFPDEKLGISDGTIMMIHDPCTARKNTKDQDAVRNIIKKLGAKAIEFEFNKNKTLCCGKKNMAMALDREKGMKMLNKRIEGCKVDKVASYCASCANSFDMAGKDGYHIAELLLGSKISPSWKNRISFVKNVL